ncbi:MAG: helix-turn-helix transcriptional regulator [Chloroflexi bacterium]|nr:helix-turn-helix transcriptional regulator [Chloroflexota bacterium]
MSPRLARLRQVRESQFLTQQELAARSGVSRVTIARLESGEVDARFSTIKKLAEALGVLPQDLLAPQG